MKDVEYYPNCYAKLLYDFVAESSEELSAKKDTIVHVLNSEETGWTMCRIDKNQGLIPSDYLSLITKPTKKTPKFPQKVRGKVIIQHSIHEHSGRYVEFAQELLKQGYAVFAMDLAGHGQSGGTKGHIDSFADWVNDFELFYDIVEQMVLGDIFIFGQGLGGNIALVYYLYHSKGLKITHSEPMGIMLCGCYFGFTPEFEKRLKYAAGYQRTNALTPMCELGFEKFTLKGSEDFWKKDNLCITDKIKAKTSNQILSIREKLWSSLELLDIPFYILQGDCDEISDSKSSLEAFQLTITNPKFKNINIIQDLKHDLLHEECYLSFYEELIEWIKLLQYNYVV